MHCSVLCLSHVDYATVFFKIAVYPTHLVEVTNYHCMAIVCMYKLTLFNPKIKHF